MGVTNWKTFKPNLSKCDFCDNLDTNSYGFVCQSLSGCIYDVPVELEKDIIDFNFAKKEIIVKHIFDVSPQSTNYKIVTGTDEIWSGTELTVCKYRDCEVSFMRVIGNPYTDGYIELKIDIQE